MGDARENRPPSRVVKAHPNARRGWASIALTSVGGGGSGSSHRIVTAGMDSTIAVRTDITSDAVHVVKPVSSTSNGLEDLPCLTGLAVHPRGLQIAISDEVGPSRMLCWREALHSDLPRNPALSLVCSPTH